MRIYGWTLLLFVFSFLSVHRLQAEDRADSIFKDSLLKELNLLNRKPSEAELQWAISKIKSKERDWGPWVAAVTALIVLTFQISYQNKLQASQRMSQLDRDRVDRLYESLAWFEGGTQKRSIGIAMIEANWQIEESFQKIWIPVLLNQAIYLLSHSKQNAAPHEIENLKRIMNLLLENRATYLVNFKERFDRLKAVLDSRKVDGKPEFEKKEIEKEGKVKTEVQTFGLDLSKSDDLKDLNDWQMKF